MSVTPGWCRSAKYRARKPGARAGRWTRKQESPAPRRDAKRGAGRGWARRGGRRCGWDRLWPGRASPRSPSSTPDRCRSTDPRPWELRAAVERRSTGQDLPTRRRGGRSSIGVARVAGTGVVPEARDARGWGWRSGDRQGMGARRDRRSEICTCETGPSPPRSIRGGWTSTRQARAIDDTPRQVLPRLGPRCRSRGTRTNGGAQCRWPDVASSVGGVMRDHRQPSARTGARLLGDPRAGREGAR